MRRSRGVDAPELAALVDPASDAAARDGEVDSFEADERYPTWWRSAAGFLWRVANDYTEVLASRHAAALAFYSIFALAPLVVVLLALLGFIYGDSAARGEVFDRLHTLIGADEALFIQEMVEAADTTHSGLVATLIGGATLLYGSSRIFLALQDALNAIWHVPPNPDAGIRGIVMNYVRAIALVPIFGALFIALTLSSAIVAKFGTFFGEYLDIPSFVPRAIEVGLSALFLTAMFAALYKFLPNRRLAWSEVSGGAAMTAALFVCGKWLIGLYLGLSTTGSLFGAAGTLAVLLTWFYLSAQIFFIGAIITRRWVDRPRSRAARRDARALTVRAIGLVPARRLHHRAKKRLVARSG